MDAIFYIWADAENPIKLEGKHLFAKIAEMVGV